jgi:hypothetical protein
LLNPNQMSDDLLGFDDFPPPPPSITVDNNNQVHISGNSSAEYFNYFNSHKYIITIFIFRNTTNVNTVFQDFDSLDEPAARR